MSWVSLRAKIKTKLDGLVTTGTLGSVMNGEQPAQGVEITAYPMAEIVRVQTDPDFLTNREDIQTYLFAINLYSRLEENDYATVETNMDSVIDTVIQAFLNDASLGGTADGRIQPVQSAASLVSWLGKPVRRDTIFLRCRKITAMT
mgnify:CR=1 FL=1